MHSHRPSSYKRRGMKKLITRKVALFWLGVCLLVLGFVAQSRITSSTPARRFGIAKSSGVRAPSGAPRLFRAQADWHPVRVFRDSNGPDGSYGWPHFFEVWNQARGAYEHIKSDIDSFGGTFSYELTFHPDEAGEAGATRDYDSQVDAPSMPVRSGFDGHLALVPQEP